MPPRDARAGHLDALVSGKRLLPRLPVALPVRIKGAHAEFRGSVRDLSAGGARLELPLAALTGEAGGDLDTVDQFNLMEYHFGDTFDVEFREALVVVEARLMRVTIDPDAPENLGLGCQFVHALGEQQQRVLGLLGEEGAGGSTWDVALGVHDLSQEADPARPVSALLLDELAVVSGPVFLGPVTFVGTRALVVRLDGVTREEAAERLTCGDLQVRLLRGARALLPEERAVYVAARYVDGPCPGSEVLLALPARLPRAVRKSFRRAS